MLNLTNDTLIDRLKKSADGLYLSIDRSINLVSRIPDLSQYHEDDSSKNLEVLINAIKTLRYSFINSRTEIDNIILGLNTYIKENIAKYGKKE